MTAKKIRHVRRMEWCPGRDKCQFPDTEHETVVDMDTVVLEQEPGDRYLWVYIVKGDRKGGPNKQLLIDDDTAELLYYKLKQKYGRTGTKKPARCSYCGSIMQTETRCSSQRCYSR